MCITAQALEFGHLQFAHSSFLKIVNADDHINAFRERGSPTCYEDEGTVLSLGQPRILIRPKVQRPVVKCHALGDGRGPSASL